MMTHDVVTVGGGLAGAVLAKSLAEKGISVLVLERERQFRDRVRGEQMQPWGVAEARELGIYELLRQTCGHEQPWIDIFLGPEQLAHRDLTATTPQGAPHFNFFHPQLQETLLDAAVRAGAAVRRGVTVTAVRRDRSSATVVADAGGIVEEIPARLVVGADGKFSSARRWSGLPAHQDEPFLVIAGVLFDELATPEDTGRIYMNPALGRGAYLFPQGGGRARAYAVYPATSGSRLSGTADVPRFVAASVDAGAPSHVYAHARAAGPLASFDAADTWVPHPYADRIALVGDAAAASDPAWGQGLSLALRDVRVLRDALLGSTDWDAAAHDYAREHDRHYGVIHEVTRAFREMFLRPGDDADRVRQRALPAIAKDPMRVPDHLFAGPDLPWNAAVRRVFFADEIVERGL